MIENRKEQKEALEMLKEFNMGLVKNMGIIVKEFSGERLDDTDAFLKGILEAINWEIQVVNGTLQLLNEDKVRIDKEEFNNKIVALNEAIATKNDTTMAKAFMELIPTFEVLGVAAAEVTA